MADAGNDFSPEQDAQTLTDAHGIMQDPKRHKKALGHIGKKVKAGQGAMDAFKKKTGKRMDKVFGPKGQSPFAKASGNQSTPFEEAEAGE